MRPPRSWIILLILSLWWWSGFALLSSLMTFRLRISRSVSTLIPPGLWRQRTPFKWANIWLALVAILDMTSKFDSIVFLDLSLVSFSGFLFHISFALLFNVLLWCLRSVCTILAGQFKRFKILVKSQSPKCWSPTNNRVFYCYEGGWILKCRLCPTNN